MSFDRFHANKANLYRIVTTAIDGSGKQFQVSKTGQVQGSSFKAAIPGISEYNRIMKIDGLNLIGEQNSFAVDVAYSDANFFSLYSFSLMTIH
jgi:putative ABC transport system permease protein